MPSGAAADPCLHALLPGPVPAMMLSTTETKYAGLLKVGGLSFSSCKADRQVVGARAAVGAVSYLVLSCAGIKWAWLAWRYSGPEV